jgi:beta-glucosidase
MRALGNIATSSSEAATIDVVFDGDSITDFWQKAGLKVWTTAFANYHPFDFGISGDTTQNLLWRLAHGQAQGLHPKLIFLMIGTNDMRYTSTPREIADGVGEIVRQYQKICPDAVIILQATNPLLAKLADGSRVIYLDFGAKFLAPDGTLTRDIMPDFLHPNAKGYQIWADAITPVLQKYIPTSTPAPSPR